MSPTGLSAAEAEELFERFLARRRKKRLNRFRVWSEWAVVVVVMPAIAFAAIVLDKS